MTVYDIIEALAPNPAPCAPDFDPDTPLSAEAQRQLELMQHEVPLRALRLQFPGER